MNDSKKTQYRKEFVEAALQYRLAQMPLAEYQNVLKVVFGKMPTISTRGNMQTFDFDRDSDPIKQALYEIKMLEIEGYNG